MLVVTREMRDGVRGGNAILDRFARSLEGDGPSNRYVDSGV